MIISVDTEALTIKSKKEKTRTIRPDDIKDVFLMADHSILLPFPLSHFFRSKVKISFIIIDLDCGHVTFSDRDDGFILALNWLENNNWKVAESEKVALTQPYIRTQILRSDI